MEGENITQLSPNENDTPTLPEEPARLGSMLVYDLEGNILLETGEMTGSWAPRVFPVGVPYYVIPYGTRNSATQRLIKMDVSVEPHVPIFEPIKYEKTDAEKLAEYEAILKQNNLLPTQP